MKVLQREKAPHVKRIPYCLRSSPPGCAPARTPSGPADADLHPAPGQEHRACSPRERWGLYPHLSHRTCVELQHGSAGTPQINTRVCLCHMD